MTLFAVALPIIRLWPSRGTSPYGELRRAAAARHRE